MKRTMGLIMGAVLAVSTIGAAISVSAAEPAAEPAAANLFEDRLGIDEAVEIALQDAGLTADQVEFTKKVNEFSDGQFFYDIHFINRGDSKFEYHLDAFTGDILEREQEPWEADDDMEYQGLADAGQAFFATDEEILNALEEAFDAAILDSGVAETDIIVYKFGVSYEDGKVVLDAGYIIPGEMEYDYDIELATGMIADMDTDLWDAEDDAEYTNLLTPPAKEAAPAQPAAQGAVDDAAAKQIALQDAGFAEADVQMIKCQKEIDDGVERYDVDFYGPDGMKYEYDIRVSDGMIIDKDAEFDD